MIWRYRKIWYSFQIYREFQFCQKITNLICFNGTSHILLCRLNALQQAFRKCEIVTTLKHTFLSKSIAGDIKTLSRTQKKTVLIDGIITHQLAPSSCLPINLCQIEDILEALFSFSRSVLRLSAEILRY